MRINLGKINRLIREAWSRGQREASRGAGKSSCRSYSVRVACEYFPDIDADDVARIAEGRSRLHWDAGREEIVVKETRADETRADANSSERPHETRRVLYLVHSLSPTQEEVSATSEYSPRSIRIRRATRVNVVLAVIWLGWLRRSFPGDTFVAPWIAAVLAESGDGLVSQETVEEASRESGLRDARAAIERCDGVVVCGRRLSDRAWVDLVEHGIEAKPHDLDDEGDYARHEFAIVDLRRLGLRDPPSDCVPPPGRSLEDWVDDWIRIHSPRASEAKESDGTVYVCMRCGRPSHGDYRSCEDGQ